MSTVIDIDDRKIGDGHPCFLSAEAGTTCNGNLDLAKQLIDISAEAGMDAVKFQTIGADANLSDRDTVYRYQDADGNWVEENMFEMFQNLAFSLEEWQEIAAYTRSRGMVFFSTGDYLEATDILEQCDVPLHKFGSWDATYEPLIIKAAKTGKPLMLDLGPASLEDIMRFFELCKQYGCGQLIPLHDFHTDIHGEMNLKVIPYLKQVLNMPVGFSAPARDDDLDILAVGLGANVLEKRITLDRRTPGHHHPLSLEPDELKRWVQRIRNVEDAMGQPAVIPPQADLAEAQKSFRTICTIRDIRAGEVFSPENLDAKRPGNGLHSRYLEVFMGRAASRNIPVNTLLDWSDL